MRTIRKIFSLRNAFALVTVVAATLIAIWGGLTKSLGLGEQVILALLGLLTIDTFIERLGALDEISENVHIIRSKIGEKEFLHVRSTEMPPLERYLEGAREFYVSGGSLAGLVPEYRQFLREISETCDLRFVLLNPNSPALEAAANWAGAPPERFKKEIEVTLLILGELIADGAPLQVRLNNSIPALSVMIVDGSAAHGRIRVGVNPHQCPPSRRPFFELTRGDDERFYALFYERYEALWEESELWTPEST
jgi:hypothetical protein